LLGRIYNEDCFEVLRDIANECEHPVIVTDPPFNIGYHYREYNDRMDEGEYFSSLAEIINEYPSVIVHYPEALHRLSMEAALVPNRIVSWVYPSNTKRQHRDIAFYGIDPDFDLVRRPYKNPTDKRIIELQKRTGGGRSYDWVECNQVKNVSREKTAHPCQMPLALMEDVIGWLSGMKDITIIDPFAGSGTTCIACERRGIPWRAIEVDQSYCNIIYERLEAEDGLA
jgi:DNA modification methylase